MRWFFNMSIGWSHSISTCGHYFRCIRHQTVGFLTNLLHIKNSFASNATGKLEQPQWRGRKQERKEKATGLMRNTHWKHWTCSKLNGRFIYHHHTTNAVELDLNGNMIVALISKDCRFIDSNIVVNSISMEIPTESLSFRKKTNWNLTLAVYN